MRLAVAIPRCLLFLFVLEKGESQYLGGPPKPKLLKEFIISNSPSELSKNVDFFFDAFSGSSC